MTADAGVVVKNVSDPAPRGRRFSDKAVSCSRRTPELRIAAGAKREEPLFGPDQNIDEAEAHTQARVAEPDGTGGRVPAADSDRTERKGTGHWGRPG